MEFVLKNDYYTVTVSEIGAELISVKDKSGRELIWQPAKNAGWTYRAPLLFPICSRQLEDSYEYGGKKYNMPMHGFIRNVRMETVCSDGSSVLLRSVSSAREAYPFEYVLTVGYTLKDDVIRMDVRVENTDGKVLPYMLGWHPGFNLLMDGKLPIESYYVRFDNPEKIHYLPKGTRPHGIPYTISDNCYRFDRQELDDTKIFRGQGSSAILLADGCDKELRMRWSDNLPYFCIWRGDKAGADYVCLEPWSDMVIDASVPESFEDKLMSRLAPGEIADYFYELSFT